MHFFIVNWLRFSLMFMESILLFVLTELFGITTETSLMLVFPYFLIMVTFTSFPLYFLPDEWKKKFWLSVMAIVWLVVGLSMGFSLLIVWIPILLGIWRSVSTVIDDNTLVNSILKRVLFNAVVSFVYVIDDIFKGVGLPPEATIIGWALFAIAIVTLMLRWSLDNLTSSDTQSIKASFKIQSIYLLLTVSLSAVFIFLHDWFAILFDFLGKALLKIIYIVMYPFLKLFEILLPWLIQDYEAPPKDMGKGFTEILEHSQHEPTFLWVFEMINWVFFSLIIIVLAIVFYHLIRRYLRAKNELSETQNRMYAKHEIDMGDSGSKISIMRTLRNPFDLRYNDQVRKLYRKFLKQYQTITNNKDYETLTPREIMEKVSRESSDYSELQMLTHIYENRRYGRKEYDKETVRRMKQALQKWHDKNQNG